MKKKEMTYQQKLSLEIFMVGGIFFGFWLGAFKVHWLKCLVVLVLWFAFCIVFIRNKKRKR